MNSRLFLAVNVLAALHGARAEAQRALPVVPPYPPTLPSAAVTFHSAITSQLQSGVRTWLAAQGASLASRRTSPSAAEGPTRAAISARFAGQNLTAAALDQLFLQVLLEQERALFDEMIRLMNEVAAARREAEQTRAYLATLEAALGSVPVASESTCSLAVCLNLQSELTARSISQKAIGITKPVEPRDARTYGDIKRAQDYLVKFQPSLEDELARLVAEQKSKYDEAKDIFVIALRIVQEYLSRQQQVVDRIISSLK